MDILKRGSTGPEVVEVQQLLHKHGCSPGEIDGDFGAATERAVRAFQRLSGLEADGVVGPISLAALRQPPDEPAGPITGVTLGIVAQMFPQTRVSNIRTHWITVLDALVDRQLGDKPMALMALATIRAETEGFVPISEFISKFNTSPGGHPFDLYDDRTDLGNEGFPDGQRFKGRGFIQLTGRFNYRVHGAEIGLGNGLVENPDLANDPKIAAALLASFLKAKEGAIRTALHNDDLAKARRLVNGGSHGLEQFIDAYRIGDRLVVDQTELEQHM
ncbi:peptidoglycan-binding protein [Nocardia tengchongensis]|uniref:peptidoglycan-binding protein n=1 Tax=Nocardia tengchongensis TaxID=2055889 RepID=UPI0036C8ECDE